MASRLNIDMLRAAEESLIRGTHATDAPDHAKEHGLSERTVWKYYARVRARWIEEEQEGRDERRAEFRQICRANIRKAWTAGEYGAAASTLRILAKLDGFEAPAKLVISGRVDVRAMSPMERRAEIDRLLRKRAEALDGTQAGPMIPEVIDV